jgi:hypothetical protein
MLSSVRPLILILSLTLVLWLAFSIELAPDPTPPPDAGESREGPAGPAPLADLRAPDGVARADSPTAAGSSVTILSATVLGTVTDHTGEPLEDFEILPPELLFG